MAKKQATKTINLKSTLDLQALAKAHATHARTSAKNGAKAKSFAYINATICHGALCLQLQNAPLASAKLLQALAITLDNKNSDNNRKRIDREKAQLLLSDMQASAKLCAKYNTLFDIDNIKRKQAKLSTKASKTQKRKSAKASKQAKTQASTQASAKE